MEYELMYLVADTKKESLGEIKKAIDDIITTAGAELTEDKIEFERKLAYEIKHVWRGIYVVQRFTIADKDTREESLTDDEMPRDIVGEITRQLNLHKDILRYIIVDATNLPSLAEYEQSQEKKEVEDKKVLKEKGEKIDEKLEKVLKI